MTVALWVLVAAFAVPAVLPVLAALRFRRYVRRWLARQAPVFTPPLSVIMPCKGLDPGFDENIRAILGQDYPDFEVIFVTATEDDPARSRLLELTAGRDNARVAVAGIRHGRSQKLNNQLAALRRVRPRSEALVFVDSDVRPHSTFLRELVAPLADEGVGATTGFRWYIPQEGGLGSYLRATWNGGGISVMADNRLAYAWGGAMAMLRETFEQARVAERWESALTDDFPLTMAVREMGLGVRFVPSCLLASHEDSTLAETLEWTNRQTVICRVYDPALWRAIFSLHAVHALAAGIGLGALLAAVLLPGAARMVWPGLALLGVVPLQMLGGAVLWSTARRLRPEVGGVAAVLKHMALVPLAVSLIFWNSLHSLRTREICWRGVRYRLLSPQETVVLDLAEV